MFVNKQGSLKAVFVIRVRRLDGFCFYKASLSLSAYSGCCDFWRTKKLENVSFLLTIIKKVGLFKNSRMLYISAEYLVGIRELH